VEWGVVCARRGLVRARARHALCDADARGAARGPYGPSGDEPESESGPGYRYRYCYCYCYDVLCVKGVVAPPVRSKNETQAAAAARTLRSICRLANKFVTRPPRSRLSMELSQFGAMANT
jgi:hypothetical protein